MHSNSYRKGVSLVEMIVVVALFAVMGVLVARVIFITLRSSSKSDSSVRVRENLNYALSVIERQLRNAETISCPTVSPTPPVASRVDYTSNERAATYFECRDLSTVGYVASGSARLTSDDIKITACSFTCTESVNRVPSSVEISLQASDANAQGIENTTITSTTKILLRTY